MESENFKLQVSPASSPVKNLMQESSGSPLYQEHRFPNVIKQNPVCGQKLVKIIRNDSYSQGNDSGAQTRKLPIITSVNKVGVNPKTFQFVSTKHLTDMCKNTDVLSNLPKPVVETISTPVLKDYTVIEPYVDDPASPVKPKPIITVPVEIIPSPELPKKESVAETPHVTIEHASTSAKQGKTPRSVFLNGAVKQISTPIRHDAELIGKIDEISKDKDLNMDSDKNILDQCPSVLKAKNIVVGVMESVFSMTQKSKKVSKLKPNVNRVQKNPRNASVGSTLECQTYNTTLNDILFGFDEIDDLTDECTSLNSSSEISAVTPISDSSNNVIDSSHSWQPDKKEINAVQLTNDKRGLPFSDEKQTVKEHSEKARKKRKLFESPHNSDTWSASECENENDIPRKKKLNPKKKRPSRLVGNLQKVTRNDVKANISSEPERTVDNISVQKSLNDSLKINPSVSPKKLKHAEKRTVKTSDKSPISTNRLQELPYVSPISNQSELSITHSESSDKIVKDVPKSPSLRNRRNSHDRADRSSIKNKSTGRVDNESKPFSENVPNFKRNISKRLSRYKISSESKKGGKYMRSNFKSEMKNKRKRKTLMRGKKKLSKPDDIIREIKTITGGNIPRGKSKKISYSSASEKDDPEFDAVSDDSESETCSSKLRNNSPGRANSRKKVRTLKVLFKRAKRKKSSNNQSMDFNPISISVLDNANNSNSVLDSNKSLNSTFREGDREKMDTSCKAESKIENDTFVCETKPEYFIVENNVQCDDASAISSMYQVASPVKNSVNTDISKVDGTKFVVSTRNSGDDEVNSNSNEVQDIRNLLLKIVETISCEPIYTDSDSDEESINSNLNNSVPELEVDSNKNVVNLPTVNENIDLNVDAESEISINSSAIDPTSSIAQNLNSELYESTINVAHSSKNLSENKKPHMAKRKCPKIKISISKTVIDTDGREESWYISERKPSTDSVQSEVSSEEAKVESEAEIICDKLNIMLEASSMPAISEKEISQSATKTCDESLEHLVQGANDNNSNTDVSSNNVENPDMTEDIPHFSNELSECEVAEQQCILPDGQQQVMGSQCSVKAFDSFAGKKEESIESVNPKEALVTETVSESGDLAKSECSVEAHASSIIESEVSVEAECSVEAVSSAGESEKQVKLECSLERVSSDVENGEPLKPEYSVEEINSAVESEEPTKSEHSMDVISSAVENEEPVKSQIFDTSAAKKEEPVIECSVKNPSDTPTDSTVRIHKELSVALEVMNNFATDVKSPKSLKRKRNSTPLRASGRSNVKVEASSDCSGKEQTSKVEKKSPKSSPHVTPVRKKNYDPEAVTIPFTMVEKKSPKSSPHVTPVRKKNYDPEAVTVPFTMGWMRELVHRANQEEGRKQSDIYYFAPEGVKLRSMREVAAYLSKKENYALTVENFTYAKELIYREPFEIERSAKQKASVCNTPSPSSNLSSVNTSKRKQHSVSKKQTPPTHSKKQTAPTYSSSSKEHSSKSPKNDTLETARNSGTRKSTRRTSLNTEECVKKENEDSDSIKPRPSRKIIKKVPFDNSFEEKTPVRKCRLDNKQNSSTENKTSAPVILSDSSTKSNTHLSANKSGKLFTSPSNNTENTSSVNLSVDKQSSNQPPKTQKRYKVKCTYSKTESMVQRPCTPLCRVAHYQYPSVQCAICLCLFHPSCVPPVSRGVKFACKPCTIVKLESNRLRVNSATASIPVCEIPDASLENIDSSLLEPEVICQTYSAALPVNCMSDRIPGVLFTQLSVPNLPFENSQRKMFFCCSYSNSPTIANNPLSNYSSTLGEVRSTLNQLKVLSSSTMPEARGVTSSQTFPSNNSSFNFTSLSSHQQKCLGIPRAAINNPVSCRYMVYNIKKPSSNICGGLQYSSMNRNIPRPVLQKNASEFSSVQPPPTVLTEQLKQPSYTYSRSEALYNTSVPSCSYQTSKSFVQDMEMERVLNPTKKTKFSVTPESNSTNIRSNHTSIRNNVSASKTVSSDIAASSSSSTDLKSLSVEDNCRDYVENALNVIVSANNNSKTCQESFKKSDALCSKQQLIGEKLGSDHTSSSSEEAAVNDCKYLPFVFKMLSICDLLRASQVCRSWRDIA
ncbi:Bromodomain adjacent to zinc finger domain protein 2B, partial [Stegodyphus mimosarum]